MDAIFKALNDPARRAMLDSLREKDGQTLTDLQAQFDMTRFGVMKHLGVLEEANLIVTVKKGRFKHHYLNAIPLQEVIDRWIEPLIAKPSAQSIIALKAQLEGKTEMADTPDFVHQTFIRTSRDALWDALTKADQMGQYHMASNTARGDTVTGGEVEFLRDDGSVMLAQKVLKIDPKSRIELTFEPKWAEKEPLVSRCVYQIDEEGPVCKLTVEHYGIVPGLEGVKEGWARWAANLKSFIETGKALKAA